VSSTSSRHLRRVQSASSASNLPSGQRRNLLLATLSLPSGFLRLLILLCPLSLRSEPLLLQLGFSARLVDLPHLRVAFLLWRQLDLRFGWTGSSESSGCVSLDVDGAQVSQHLSGGRREGRGLCEQAVDVDLELCWWCRRAREAFRSAVETLSTGADRSGVVLGRGGRADNRSLREDDPVELLDDFPGLCPALVRGSDGGVLGSSLDWYLRRVLLLRAGLDVDEAMGPVWKPYGHAMLPALSCSLDAGVVSLSIRMLHAA
jgi:hypothetical protein